MIRWKLKECPRCGGDVFIDKDLETWYEQCLQCSHRRELKQLFDFKRQAVPVGRLRAKKQN